MHKDIFITLYLKHSFDGFVINEILSQALKLNIKMYKYTCAKSYFESPRIDIKLALQRIMNRDDEAPVLCSFEDTGFFLYFTKSDKGTCEFSLGGTNFPWKKEFWNGKEAVDFDLSRYIRLMMMLVKGLEIQKVHSYIGWS